MIMYLLLDFILTRDEIGRVTRYTPNHAGSLVELPPLHTVQLTRRQTALIILAGLTYTFVIGISRWILRTTYLNQLTFGWLLGLWLACTFAFIIRIPFHNYIKLLLEER